MAFNATLLFVFLSFAVFAALMKALFFDPVGRIKHEREARLTEDRQHAEGFLDQCRTMQAEYEAQLRDARKRAQQLILELRQTAKATATQTVLSARTQAASDIERRMTELADWRENTYGELAAERAALTQTIVEKITNGKVPALSADR